MGNELVPFWDGLSQFGLRVQTAMTFDFHLRLSFRKTSDICTYDMGFYKITNGFSLAEVVSDPIEKWSCSPIADWWRMTDLEI